MTYTNTLAPTDAEILDAAEDFRSQYTHGGTTFDEFDEIGFARAVLAKWGAPALASSDPDPMLPETKYNLGWASGWDAHARAHPPEKPAAVPAAWAATSEEGNVEALGMNQSRRFDTPLYAAQAQENSRKPMTKQQKGAMLKKLFYRLEGVDGDDWDWMVIDAVEAHHGIK